MLMPLFGSAAADVPIERSGAGSFSNDEDVFALSETLKDVRDAISATPSLSVEEEEASFVGRMEFPLDLCCAIESLLSDAVWGIWGAGAATGLTSEGLESTTV